MIYYGMIMACPRGGRTSFLLLLFRTWTKKAMRKWCQEKCRNTKERTILKSDLQNQRSRIPLCTFIKYTFIYTTMQMLCKFEAFIAYKFNVNVKKTTNQMSNFSKTLVSQEFFAKKLTLKKSVSKFTEFLFWKIVFC